MGVGRRPHAIGGEGSAVQQGRSRITVDLGSPKLYRALRIATIERDCSVREANMGAIEQRLVLESHFPLTVAVTPQPEKVHG
jgi:hypothetical protein